MKKLHLKRGYYTRRKKRNGWLFRPGSIKNDPFYVRPIDDDVEKLFDPKKKNKLLRKGQAIRYLLFNEQQKK